LTGSILATWLGMLGLAITLFASTNVDDLLVLVGFFADPVYRRRDIVVGQFAGVAVLFAVSFALSLCSLVIPRAYVGFLGIFPILIGARKLLALGGRAEETAPAAPARGYGRMAGVALVTMANGGDNIGIYVPAFAVQTGNAMVLIALIFVAMTALWCYLAHWMVSHPRLGVPIRKYAPIVAPVVLIGLGIVIAHNAGTLAWLLHRR
jgi:cadmium resistance protein CadD (predicted permease)